MCLSKPGWMSFSKRDAYSYKGKCHKIHVDMADIIEINTKANVPYVRVEPQITMGQLISTLLPQGWTLKVVPSFETLTVGGLVNGCGVESSSFSAGLFADNLLAFDLILPSSELVHCSPTQNSDLFSAVPLSHGTLGLVVCVDLALQPAKPWVRLRYLSVHNKQEFCMQVEQEAEEKIDFKEAIMYSANSGVIVTGTLVDTAEPHLIRSFSKFWDPWFYQHVRGQLALARSVHDYVPLRDYYFRHSRSIFWQTQEVVPFGNHPFFRYFLGWTLPDPLLVQFIANFLLSSLWRDRHIFQNLLVPMKDLEAFVDLCNDEFNIQPMWICPLKLASTPERFMKCSDEGDLFVNIGTFGVPKSRSWNVVDSCRRIESFVRQVRGFHGLSNPVTQSYDEFCDMFDHSTYNHLRAIHNCEHAFPRLFDKVKRAL
eukprot:TRINITY_DN8335_c0_g1_i11.p1 TRINITY_DN8335_c0_g1~~TRINITY_DN8335_c0_g1_i11.p1  ORF type:complete len:481 (+),score=72.56 TRINITY_DN8335_c0_g1_i11:164-1444(+)